MIDPAELRDVFDRAVSLPPAERVRFLARACAHNDALHREVERLLSADVSGTSFLDGMAPATPSDAATSFEGDSRGRLPSLTLGTRLGPYEITAWLGAGGMGEVYRARDIRLARSVVKYRS